MDRHGLTLAYNCNSFLSVRLRDRKPLPIGVVIGPFSPMPLRYTQNKQQELITNRIEHFNIQHGPSSIRQRERTKTESRFSLVMKLFVLGSTSLPTCCSSHSIGASAALKIFFTASAISGPMPAVRGRKRHCNQPH